MELLIKLWLGKINNDNRQTQEPNQKSPPHFIMRRAFDMGKKTTVQGKSKTSNDNRKTSQIKKNSANKTTEGFYYEKNND
jgi:hypothetical protein